jgi:hypothetical protein
MVAVAATGATAGTAMLGTSSSSTTAGAAAASITDADQVC